MQTPESMELFDLRMSEEARPLYDRVVRFLQDVVAPMQEEYFRLGEGRADPWSFASGQLEALDAAKNEAKAAGLWNFFLPDSEVGGLTNLDYAYIAVELGKYPLGSESLNCSAPDTGNMEVLERVGSPEQKARWLEPLLDGEKYYISGAGDPRCKIMIVMCQTNPDAPAHGQQSQILVPMDTPGVEVLGPMTVFGRDDAPHGHMHIRFTDVRVPASNMLLGEGRGFEISQVRLGPGRIHHCMRSVGQGEKALELMVRRGKFREAFGKPILNLGKNMETVSRARIELDACRLRSEE